MNSTRPWSRPFGGGGVAAEGFCGLDGCAKRIKVFWFFFFKKERLAFACLALRVRGVMGGEAGADCGELFGEGGAGGGGFMTQ